MCRSLDLELTPREHTGAGDNPAALTINTYTYERSPDRPRDMAHDVHLSFQMRAGYVGTVLTTDEARVLANQLLQAADQADEQKSLDDSLDDIHEQLRDPEFDSRAVRFVHPDVVYTTPEQFAATCAANPGKLVIAERDDAEVAP